MMEDVSNATTKWQVKRVASLLNVVSLNQT